MTTESRLDVHQITGLDTLVGKIGGIRDFPKFMAAVMATPEGCTVVLDWSGIELVTASYFGETVLPLLKMSTAGHLDRYFLLVGLHQNSLDELKLVVEFHDLVVLVGDAAAHTKSARNVRVLGKLDSPYFETLEAIKASRSASASTLHKDHQKKPVQIGKTGWANRLAYLSRLRLVRKQRVGRELVFQPVYGGHRDGR